MGKILGTVCIALSVAFPLRAQQDSVQVTTYVRCPQTALLDSLNAYEAAAARRDSALRAFFTETVPACPINPVPVPEEKTLLDHIAYWGPLVLTAATLIAVLATKHDTKVIRETTVIYKDDDDQ